MGDVFFYETMAGRKHLRSSDSSKEERSSNRFSRRYEMRQILCRELFG